MTFADYAKAREDRIVERMEREAVAALRVEPERDDGVRVTKHHYVPEGAERMLPNMERHRLLVPGDRR